MANNEAELLRAVIAWANACRDRGMEVIASKSKIMHITLKHQMGERKDKVTKMEYLDTIMNVNGKIDTEINNRVQKTNQFYYQTNQTMAGKKEINNHNKTRIYKIVYLQSQRYGSES
jgi:hypothetical protein